MFYIFLLFLGVGISRVSSDSEESDDSKTVHESQMSVSTLNNRWLKSKSAGRDLSLATTFDSEEPDNPNIPSDFDARYGLNKTRYIRTPYPILSRRESYEDYGKAPNQDESIKTEEISFDFSSSKDKKVHSAKPKMTLQSARPIVSTKKSPTTLKTLEKSHHSKLPKETESANKSKQKDVLESKTSKKSANDSKLRKAKQGAVPTMGFNQQQTISSANLHQNYNLSKTQAEVKLSDQAAAEVKISVSSQKNQNPPKSPLQAPKSEVKTTFNKTVNDTTKSPSTEKINSTTAGSKFKQIVQESLSYAASHLFRSHQKTNPITISPTVLSIPEQQPSNTEAVLLKAIENAQNVRQTLSPKLTSGKFVDSKQQTLKTVEQVPSPPLSKPLKLTPKQSGVQQKMSKPVPIQQKIPNQVSSQQQPPKPVPSQQPPPPKPVPSQQQPPKPVASQQPPPKPVPSQQQPPKPVASQQPPPKPVPSQQPTPKPVPSQQPPPKPVPLQQPPPKPVPSQQPPPKPVPSQQPPPKPVPLQQPPPKPVPSQQPPPKPVPLQQQPPNPVPSQQQPPKPVPSQQPPKKPVLSQQPSPKPVPLQKQPPNLVPSQQQPSTPIPSQQQPPKQASSQQQPPKPVPSQQKSPIPVSSQKQPPKTVPSREQSQNTVPSQQQPQNTVPSQQQPTKPVPSQQQPPKPVPSQQQPLKPVPSQRQPPKPVPSQQQPEKPVPSQQQPPKPVPSQQQTPKPVPSQQQPPKPVPSQQQLPKPVPSQQQPPKPVPSQQQLPKPVPSQQQPPKPVPSQQQPPKPVPSQQQLPKPVPSQQQPPKPVPSQQQPPKPVPLQQQPQNTVPSQLKSPKPVTFQQQPLSSNVKQETVKPTPIQNPPPRHPIQTQVTIKPMDTQQPTYPPKATSPTPVSQQSATTCPQSPVQQTTKPVVQPPGKVQVFEQPVTKKEAPQIAHTPSQAISEQMMSKPPTDQRSKIPTKTSQTKTIKPISPSQSVTFPTVTIQPTTVKVPVNQDSALSKIEISTDSPQVSLTTESNIAKQSITKSVSSQRETFQSTSIPKPTPIQVTLSPLKTSKPSEGLKPPLNPAGLTTVIPSCTLVTSPNQNSVSDQIPITKAADISSSVIKSTVPVKVTVQPVEKSTSQIIVPTQQSVLKESVVTEETVATQSLAASQQFATNSPVVEQTPTATPAATRLPTLSLTDKVESNKPVATEQSVTQSHKPVLTEQPTVTRPSTVTTQSVVAEQTDNSQPPAPTTHTEVRITQKHAHDTTTHVSSIHKALTVASKKKTTVRAYDKILSKAGDMIKPKATTKTTTEKVLSTSQTSQELTEKTEPSFPTALPIMETEPPYTPPPVTEQPYTPPPVVELHATESLMPTLTVGTTPLFEEVRSRPSTPPTSKQELPQHIFQRPPSKETPVFKNAEDPSSKLNRPKGRRAVGRIVLKPPPEDWPQPEAVHGAKQVPLAPEFTAKIPPMGSYVEAGKRKSGYKAESFVSPPYMGHVKIDLVPPPERPATINKGANDTLALAPPPRWRIRGRKDRPTYGGYQGSGGLSVRLTMKPATSQYFIPDNISLISPTERSARPFRTYINFRQRGPMNVGRLFGPPPPPPPPPFPQPPPQHFHNPPFNQAPFPQHPQFPHPPFPPFPRGPPPHPRFGPPPHPRFGQGRPPPPPPFGPPPPFAQGPPPPPPHFQRGPPPPHQYGPPPAQPPYPPQPPTPAGPLPILPSDVLPPPPSPYPTGAVFPPIMPFYDNIPTISPIDNVPAPWPRRQVFMGTFQPKPFVPRNFSDYKGPRRGRAYEQFGKADLRPKRVRFYDDMALMGTPKSPLRMGSGYGAEFQSDVTRGPYVPGPQFMRRTWPTRANRFGYEPYRRSNDRRRPFGGFGRFGAEKPPVLGDFGQFKPYRRLDFGANTAYNFSRPTRSYTFPPRLRMAIRNATYQRRSFRRFDRDRFNRDNLRLIPAGTYKSYGLGDNIVHDHDHYGNLITRKGHIMNLHQLKRLFDGAPMERAPVLETMESVTQILEAMESMTAAPVMEAMELATAASVLEAMESKTAAPVMEAKESLTAAPVLEAKESITTLPVFERRKPITAAPIFEPMDSEVVTVIPEEAVNKLMEDFMKGKPPPKPVGMTAKEALRAAAREAIKDAEMEAYDRGETIGGGLGRRRKGGFRPRGERGRSRGRGRGNFRFGSGGRNFRRAKRSVDEDVDFLRQARVRRELRLDYINDSGDYLTGPGARSRSSGDGGSKRGGDPPLRMRRFHPRRGKGRPLRWG